MTFRNEIQGSGLDWQAPEPWPDSVSGSQLLNNISKTLKKYLVLPPEAADTIALWVLYTWTFDAFNVSPILAITSPTKRCGKTTVVTMLKELASRSVAASNITPAGLFRFVEQEKPTLIIDEADRFLLRREELRGILNSGHTRAAALVIRTSGDSYEPRSFSTWCPKAIAMIGRLDDTLQDRCIEIRMLRKMKNEKTAILRADRLPQEVEDYRRQAARWTEDKTEAIREAEPQIPEQLNSRAQDN